MGYKKEFYEKNKASIIAHNKNYLNADKGRREAYLSRLQNYQKLKMKEEKFCEICDTSLKYYSWSSHLKSVNHCAKVNAASKVKAEEEAITEAITKLNL